MEDGQNIVSRAQEARDATTRPKTLIFPFGVQQKAMHQRAEGAGRMEYG